MMATAHAAEPGLSVTANRSSIYLGESIILTVNVSGDTDPEKPDLAGLPPCAQRLLGSNPESAHNVTIINGVMTTTSFVGRHFYYEVTPTTNGTFRAGPIRATVNGIELIDPGPVIQVEGIAEQNDVRIELTSSRETALVDETFDVEMRIMLRRLSGTFVDHDPVLIDHPPQLAIPYLDAPPDTVESPSAEAIMDSRRVRQRNTPGFGVNDRAATVDPFGGLFNSVGLGQSVPVTYMFDRSTVETNGSRYFCYTLRLPYTARKEGTATFGPVTFKGNWVQTVNGEQPVSLNVFAVGKAVVVRVTPPPEAGRPASYAGVMTTQLTVVASIDTPSCNVGDPIKLMLAISGPFRSDALHAPDLSNQTNLLTHFRVYSDTMQSRVIPNGREYSCTIRPTIDGTLEVPPIEVAFFNTTTRRYEVARSKALPLRANKTTDMAMSNILESTVIKRPVSSASPDAAVPPPAPVGLTPAAALREPIRITPWQQAVLAAGPLAYGILMLAGFALAHSPVFIRWRIKRGAAAHCREALNALAVTPSHAGGIHAALCRYLADRLQIKDAALTPADAGLILRQHGIPAGLSDAIAALMLEDFNAGYRSNATGADGNTSDFPKRAAELVSQLERSLP
jgi:hypothetical protein